MSGALFLYFEQFLSVPVVVNGETDFVLSLELNSDKDNCFVFTLRSEQHVRCPWVCCLATRCVWC